MQHHAVTAGGWQFRFERDVFGSLLSVPVVQGLGSVETGRSRAFAPIACDLHAAGLGVVHNRLGHDRLGLGQSDCVRYDISVGAVGPHGDMARLTGRKIVLAHQHPLAALAALIDQDGVRSPCVFDIDGHIEGPAFGGGPPQVDAVTAGLCHLGCEPDAFAALAGVLVVEEVTGVVTFNRRALVPTAGDLHPGRVGVVHRDVQ